MMHREIIVRKKAPVIALVLLTITVMLYLHEGLKFIHFDSRNTLLVCNTIIVIVTSYIILKEFISCRISYKYAVIANKLIINKISKNQEKNLSSIKISDIVYLGKRNGQPRGYDAKQIGNYTFDKLNTVQYCCVYKFQESYYKFYFQPSECFINRVKKHMANKNSQAVN
ncbi:MAG: hypothetical protein RSD13_03480 [Clostridium sp.]|uniref:hypothetical protein n=1 Tax=Clostridium sp. TaxID=1506 RepID=UPI002FC62AF2